MQRPIKRITVRGLMVTIAVVGVVCGAEMMRRRRAALLTTANTIDKEEFMLRGDARRLVLVANLYENPPSSEEELLDKWEEMHPLPHSGCMGTYPTMQELTRHARTGDVRGSESFVRSRPITASEQQSSPESGVSFNSPPFFRGSPSHPTDRSRPLQLFAL